MNNLLPLLCLLLVGCQAMPGQQPFQMLPDIECNGKAEFSVAGPVGGMVKADCDRFKLTHVGAQQ